VAACLGRDLLEPIFGERELGVVLVGARGGAGRKRTPVGWDMVAMFGVGLRGGQARGVRRRIGCAPMERIRRGSGGDDVSRVVEEGF
jgi:hypothetical protein